MDAVDELILAIEHHCPGMDRAHMPQAGRHPAAGWPGMIYRRNACNFADAHAFAIWESLGLHGGLDRIHKFALELGKTHFLETWDGFRTLMAWWALRVAGRRVLEQEDAVEEKVRSLGLAASVLEDVAVP